MYYLIDIGSSSVKLYEYDGNALKQRSKVSYTFSKEYTAENQTEMTCHDREIICNIVNSMKKEYSLCRNNTKVFATGHFRYITNGRKLVDEFYQQTGLFFNIISQDLEFFFQSIRFIKYSKEIGPTIVVNIGGGSIEIGFYDNGKEVCIPVKLPFGTNDIRSVFTNINSSTGGQSLIQVVGYVLNLLPGRDIQFQSAILIGGELTFMRQCNYPLEPNLLFDDTAHPSAINIGSYIEYNQQIFEKQVDFLLEKMPYNPGWMQGARAYCAIAQAVCIKYGVSHIIPSDLNMIDGVVLQEARTVTVCGSFNKYLSKITSLITKLREKGYQVLSPQNTEVVGEEGGFVLFKNDVIKNHCTWPVESLHFQAIEKSDMIIICNYDNYIGYSTSIEIGGAYMCRKKIVFLEDNEISNSLDSPFEIGLLLFS